VGKTLRVDGFPQGSHLPKPCEKSMKNDYYTYAYLRKDGTPYYIGKGRRDRAFKKHQNVAVPPEERILFLKRNLTEEEAFRHEIYMIAVFGRKNLGTGILWNYTDGGEGNSGAVRDGEFREKISKAMKGRKFTDEWRRKISEAKTGKTTSTETKNKIREKLEKKIEITFPSGRIGVFSSRKLATLYLPLSLGTLGRLLNGKPGIYRDKGYSARYLPTEATQ